MLKIIIPDIESFIGRHEIDDMILQTSGTLIGRNLKNIDIHKLETILKANPYIEAAKVYADMDGVINIRIHQREPILRILNFTNQDFYIDKNV